MRIEKVKINPQIAEDMLSRNTHNRKLNGSVVRAYAKSMRDGEWQLSPEPISFYKSGDLRDGQHRLSAVIAADAEIEFLVAYDVPNDSTICDRQQKRSHSNLLQMAGLENAVSDNTSAGAIRLLLRFSSPMHTVTDSALVKFAKENGELIARANLACRTASTKPICRKSSVVATFVCALWCGVPAETIDRFAEVANTGFYSDDTESAAIAFRNTMISTERAMHGEVSQKLIMDACANALTDFVNRQGRRLRYTNPKNKYFPEAKATLLYPYVREDA